MDRFWMYSAYHNYVKPYRIRLTAEDRQTHAERAGIATGSITRLWKRFFTHRFFVSHLDLSEPEWYSWYRCYATPLEEEALWYPGYAAA